jgi:pyruvate/2-oxoglutarate dehydrogenase complex dihydrolipoamide dehydrogenase (E3) component
MSRYDLLVLGAGATGLAAARAARKAGRSVAIVDKAEPGGDCTHFGCVPSKTLLDLAHRVAGARAGQQWGLSPVGEVDFGKVMRHVHDVIDTIAADESAQQLQSEGIDLVRGWARVTAPDTLDVEGRVLHGSRLVLATGASASIPPIDGLDSVDHLDNRTLFDLTEQPEHLLVMGGGAIGVELAQAFSQLGSRVTLVEAAERILTKEEPEASAVLTTVLERSGVVVRTGSGVQRVSAGPTLHLADGSSLSGSHLLVAVGRRPATSGMGLEEVGIELGKQGQVVTDGYLRTSVTGVFAAGDCTTPLQFTHVGDEQGRLAAGNAFARGAALPGPLGGMTEFDGSAVPWVTFTDPEVGRVGMTEQEAYDSYGERARVATVTLDEMDRPRTSSHTDGYLKVIAGPRPLARHQLLDRVIGLTAVMPAGGEIAAMGAVAMHTGMLAGRLAQTIAPYPTYALGLRMAAGRLFGDISGSSWRPARPQG